MIFQQLTHTNIWSTYFKKCVNRKREGRRLYYDLVCNSLTGGEKNEMGDRSIIDPTRKRDGFNWRSSEQAGMDEPHGEPRAHL